MSNVHKTQNCRPEEWTWQSIINSAQNVFRIGKSDEARTLVDSMAEYLRNLFAAKDAATEVFDLKDSPPLPALPMPPEFFKVGVSDEGYDLFARVKDADRINPLLPTRFTRATFLDDQNITQLVFDGFGGVDSELSFNRLVNRSFSVEMVVNKNSMRSYSNVMLIDADVTMGKDFVLIKRKGGKNA